ncbi:MAG: Zn-ribbon domain-containing OB-fold protein [Gemmatimonadota bacterium]
MPSPRYHREIPARYRLEAGKCASCGKVSYPARMVCPNCRGEGMEKVNLTPKGTVVTSTVVHVPPDEFLNEAPYAMAVVETPEGARFMTQVVDCDPSTVMPGLVVDLEFRLIRKEGKSGILCYGHKGVPGTV